MIIMGIFFGCLHFGVESRKSPLVVYIFYWPFLHIMGWVAVNMKWEEEINGEDKQFIYVKNI